ncbi:YesL family protein [Clostridium sp. Marseille-P2415]|uniref:YesL family protein n=1 Tax=Clostridium sp. Marseille-P2415 TaxID=1805471 RepID=UPI000988726B|nr:YesL family protein [Clostridium sp. Marseille-P2415]
MLSGFFNYDNPVWRFIGKFGDLIILNILWLVCSIPVFTIGASTTAVYYVTLKLARDDDGYTIRSFFKSFKENFKQSTIIWLILLAAGIVLGVDMYFFTRLFTGGQTFRTVMLTVFLAMIIVYAAVFTYIFPLQARFFNTVKRTFFNAFFMSIRHLFRTIGMIVIDGVLVAAGFVFVIPPMLMIFMLFGFPLLAFINSYILTPVFQIYMPKEEQKEEELRPLFADEEEDVSSILLAKGDEHSKEGPKEETEAEEIQNEQE